MAGARRDKDLIDRLHASGVRSRAVKLIAGATDRRGEPAKQVHVIMKKMHAVLDEVQDRATGGPAKRSAAAKKAAQTRKRNAAKPRAGAKKSSDTRSKSAS